MNILNIDHGIIVHQVNCQGVMGCGIAKRLRDLYPIIYTKYKQHEFKLGDVQFIQVNKIINKKLLYICNLAGQDRYGRNKRHTDYKAVYKGLKTINKWASKQKLPVYIPRNMGCINAGGNWNSVLKLITKAFSTCEYYIF